MFTFSIQGQTLSYFSLSYYFYVVFAKRCETIFEGLRMIEFSCLLADEIIWPEGDDALPADAQDLITRLLKQNPLDRLGTGNCSLSQMDEVKSKLHACDGVSANEETFLHPDWLWNPLQAELRRSSSTPSSWALTGRDS